MTTRESMYDLSSLACWRVSYPSASRELGGYLFIPDGDGPFPAMVINHGSNGLTRWFERVAKALNEMGYAAFVPIRRGYSGNPGPYWQSLCTAPEGSDESAHQFLDALVQENDDVLAALAWLSERTEVDATRIGVMGISFGGIMTLFAAARPSTFRAGVSFAAAGMAWPMRGSRELRSALIEAMSRVTIPLFLIQAQNDFSLAPLYALGGELARLGKVHEARVYAANGTTPMEGHVLMLTDIDAWRKDVQRFLARWLAPVAG